MVENLTLLEKMLLEVHKDMNVVVADIAAIKVDLKDHMRRTALLEAELKFIRKQIYMAQGASAFLTLAASAYAFFHHLVP